MNVSKESLEGDDTEVAVPACQAETLLSSGSQGPCEVAVDTEVEVLVL